MAKSKLEYIWLDGYFPTQNMRSKTYLIDNFSGKLEDVPVWSFDGSSTRQAEGNSSDCLLKPVAIFPLEIKSYKKVKILQWLGSNQSDYCCPIIKNDIFKDHQKFEFIWKEILKEIENFDIIFLNKQPEYVEKTLNPFVQFLKNVFHSKVYQINLSKFDDNLSYIKNNKFMIFSFK